MKYPLPTKEELKKLKEIDKARIAMEKLWSRKTKIQGGIEYVKHIRN